MTEDRDREPRFDDNPMEEPHEHATAAGAPGASGPGDPGYEGAVTVGEEGADPRPPGEDPAEKHAARSPDSS